MHRGRLPKLLKRLARFEALIIDNIGYVQHSRQEMEVLFLLLSQRYEWGSVLLTSNLAFSQWERIFKDPWQTRASVPNVDARALFGRIRLLKRRFRGLIRTTVRPGTIYTRCAAVRGLFAGVVRAQGDVCGRAPPWFVHGDLGCRTGAPSHPLKTGPFNCRGSGQTIDSHRFSTNPYRTVCQPAEK